MSRMHFRHRKFLANYILLAGNGVQAVYAAGYKQGYDSACVTASRLLRNAKVSQELEKHVLKAQMSADDVLTELADVAQIETKLDGNQKLKALELLGKFHKLFTDKLETTSTEDSTSKLTISKVISATSKREGKSQTEVEYELQSRFADKSAEDYDPSLSPEIHPEIWPSGCMIDPKVPQIESDALQ